jgi:hypothetical protein
MAHLKTEIYEICGVLVGVLSYRDTGISEEHYPAILTFRHRASSI